MARSSLMESQSHLLGFVDKRYIKDVRLEVNQLAETALEEFTGLMEYLQSPEALRNARRARERRTEQGTEQRMERRTLNRIVKVNTNREQRRQKSEQRLALRRSKICH
jgi:hypothetical protein